MGKSLDGERLADWIEDRFFYCDNADVNAAVGDIIEKIHLMMMDDSPKAEQKPDFFEDFLNDRLLEDEWNDR